MIRILIFISFIFTISCQDEVEICSDQILTDKDKLEQSFKSINEDSGTFKNLATKYLEDHEEKKCKISDVDFFPHDQIKEVLSELNSSTASIKIVYGDDNRVNLINHPDPSVQQLSKSVAALIPNSNIDSLGQITSSTLGESFNLCPGQRFENEISPAICTGFLVDDDLIMTAGHCVRNDSDCSAYKWVFDFHSDSDSVDPTAIYSCESIVSRREDNLTGVDYAVIKLDKKVTNREALKLRLDGNVPDAADIFVLGHPSGIPMKFADDASVKNNSSRVFFTTNLDTFGGNSGSPVFNYISGLVEGILVRGDDDYVVDNGCRVVNTVDQAGDGEEVLKLSVTEGLEHYLLKSLSETNTKLQGSELIDVTNFSIKLNIQKGFTYNLYGRRFLDSCVYQISERYQSKEQIMYSASDCSDEKMQSIYEKFKDLI